MRRACNVVVDYVDQGAEVMAFEESSSQPAVSGNGNWDPNEIKAGIPVGIHIHGELQTATAGVLAEGESSGWDGVLFEGEIHGSLDPRFVVEIDYELLAEVTASVSNADPNTYAASSYVAMLVDKYYWDEGEQQYLSPNQWSEEGLAQIQNEETFADDSIGGTYTLTTLGWKRIKLNITFLAVTELSTSRGEVTVTCDAKESPDIPISGTITLYDYNTLPPNALTYREIE